MKIVLAYLFFLVLAFASYAFLPEFKQYIIPSTLFFLTFLLSKRVNFSLNSKHFIFALKVSFIVLVPSWLLANFLMLGYDRSLVTNNKLNFPSLNTIFYMLFLVSIPEEFFFRSFIQRSLGNDLKANIITSSLFSLAHSPRFFFYGDFLSILTFFPSLVMGWLYMKTQNTLSSIIFHFLSNLLFIMFLQKLW